MVLIGRLTKDAVIAQLKDERKVVNFTLAVNNYYKPKNSDKGVTVTTYINCGYWISPAIISILKKVRLSRSVEGLQSTHIRICKEKPEAHSTVM